MPVGTKGTVKSLHPDEVRALGAAIVLGNTYHLHFRPGDELIAELGGLHAFSGWDGPILTDSGGFQVFSLRDTLLAVDDDGVTFRSVYDGAPERFTPELRGGDPAAPRLGHRDVPRCLRAGRRRPARAGGGRSPDDALGDAAARGASARPASSSSASRRAAPIPSCGAGRSRRSRRSTSTATPSAGSRSARTGTRCSTRSAGRPRCYRPSKPRYFMGIGDPEGILEVIARGIDMFDCVLPTRTARTGSALTADGRLNLRNARYARDPGPLEAGCDCPACTRSRARTSAISSIRTSFSGFGS